MRSTWPSASAKSATVRQSIIRHAFRYFMGRNEFLSDSKTLIDADRPTSRAAAASMRSSSRSSLPIPSSTANPSKTRPMNSRRDFLKTSVLGAGAMALAPSFNQLFAAPAARQRVSQALHLHPQIQRRSARWKSRSSTFSAKDKALDEKKQPLEVDLDKHELPMWLRGLDEHKENMTILQGLSAKMSENGHYSFSSVMGCFKSNRNTLSAHQAHDHRFRTGQTVSLALRPRRAVLRRRPHRHRLRLLRPGPQTRNYCYADPDTARNELFKSVLNPGRREFRQRHAHLPAEQGRPARQRHSQGYEKQAPGSAHRLDRSDPRAQHEAHQDFRLPREAPARNSTRPCQRRPRRQHAREAGGHDRRPHRRPHSRPDQRGDLHDRRPRHARSPACPETKPTASASTRSATTRPSAAFPPGRPASRSASAT